MRAIVIMRDAAGCFALAGVAGKRYIDFSFSVRGAAGKMLWPGLNFLIFFLSEISRINTLLNPSS